MKAFKRISWRTIILAVVLLLVAVLLWDYVWINLLRSGSVDSP